jgi:alpha-D-xyloside xylohydrolase
MFVRAGSILPLGPEMQYVGEKAWDNLELRIYPGADGSFTLYEDEGDGYNYEKGIYSTIAMQWNDRTRTLTIGERQGSFPGMLNQRLFTIVLPDGSQQQVDYDGQKKQIKL